MTSPTTRNHSHHTTCTTGHHRLKRPLAVVQTTTQQQQQQESHHSNHSYYYNNNDDDDDSSSSVKTSFLSVDTSSSLMSTLTTHNYNHSIPLYNNPTTSTSNNYSNTNLPPQKQTRYRNAHHYSHHPYHPSNPWWRRNSNSSSSSSSTNINHHCKGILCTMKAIMIQIWNHYYRRRYFGCPTRNRNTIPYLLFLCIMGRLTWTFSMLETALDTATTTITSTTTTSSSSSSSFSSSWMNHYYSSNSRSIISYTKNNNNHPNHSPLPIIPDNQPSSYRTLLQEYHIPFLPESSSTSLSFPNHSDDLRYEMEQNHFNPWMLQRFNTTESSSSTTTTTTTTTTQTFTQQQQQERQQRSRPPIYSNSNTFDWTVLLSSLSWMGSGTTTTKSISISPQQQDETTMTTNHTLYHWDQLCPAAQLNQKSRIVITNALTVSMATPFTLFLYHQCHVKSILIVDAMLPNLKQERMRYMDTSYRRLYRNIPSLKFTVPTATVGLEKRMTTTTTSTTTKEDNHSSTYLTWLDSYRPTHVIHFEMDHPNDHDDNNNNNNLWKDHITPSGHSLYQMTNSILSMKQLLYYQQTRTTNNILSILHIINGPLSLQLSSESMVVPEERTPLQKKNGISPTWLHRINHMLANYAQWYPYTNKPTTTTTSLLPPNNVRIHQLHIPYSIFGPLVASNNRDMNDTNQSNSAPLPPLYIEDAIVGVLKALKQQQQVQRPDEPSRMILSVSSSRNDEDDDRKRIETYIYQDRVYQHHESYPYRFTGTDDFSKVVSASDTSRDQYKTTLSHIYNLYGVYKTRFPCASTCWNEELYNANDDDDDICDASVLDTIHPISASITKHCSYVIYYVNLDKQWNQMLDPPKAFLGVSPPTAFPKLCRIAFVSSKSVMLQNLIKEQYNEKDQDKVLQEYNGKLVVNEWSLIWVDEDMEFTSSNSIEVDILLRLEPSRFFGSNVKKVMYTDSDVVLTTSDVALVHIMSNINRPARPQGYATNEYRSGLDNIHRSIHHPPSRARSVAFFASEMEDPNRPRNLGEYIQRHMSDIKESEIKKSRPINYYKQMSHWVQSDTNRPLRDGIGTLLHVPWIWISMKFMVHDLRSDAAQTFRCNWYDAYLYWGTERIPGAEDLSLAYVFAKHRLLGSIGPGIDDGSWLPQYNTNSDQEPIVVGDDAESFIRIMSSSSY